MDNLPQDREQIEVKTAEVSDTDYEGIGEIEDAASEGLYSELLLNEILQSYQDAWNKNNDKYEIRYNCTLTTHKVATKEGNKDVAYLRLEKAIRSKAAIIEDPNLPNELKLPEWSAQLIHTEAYPFRNLQERVNPKARWKEYLFQSCIARLVAAGLEYAELLQRMKNTNLEEERRKEENKLDLVITDQLPRPLNEDELKYKEEVKQMRNQ